MKTFVLDFEANGLLDTVTQIWCLSLADPETGIIETYSDHIDPGSVLKAIHKLLEADRLVAHNGIGYDFRVIEKLYGIVVPLEKMYDTLVVGRLLDPERSSGHSLRSYGLEMGIHKGEHTDFSQFSEEMLEYCEQDVRVTCELYRRQLKEIPEWGQSVDLEHKVAWLIQKQHEAGFQFDRKAGELLAAELLQEMHDLEKQLQEVFPPRYVPIKGTFVPKKSNDRSGYVALAPCTKVVLESFNPGSRQQVADRLVRKYGWKPTVYTDGGSPEVSESVLARLNYPEAGLLARYFRIQKKYSQLAGAPKANGSGGGWLHHLDSGNRIHGRVNSNGAVTGRMTHSNPNSANIDKDPRMRSLFIARPGWKLVGCDADGLELRMLAHYLARWDGGEYASAVVDGKKEDSTDAHSRTRDIVGLYSRDSAKTFIYALIYGGGDAKLGQIVMEDAKKAGKPIKGNPKVLGATARSRIERGIKGLGELRKAVSVAHRTKGYLKGLDGRKLWVRSEHSALNTLLQSAGAVVMKQALWFTYSVFNHEGLDHGQHYNFVANVHDEFQIEIHPDLNGDSVGQTAADCIREAGMYLGVRCPLAGSYAIGNNWSETH